MRVAPRRQCLGVHVRQIGEAGDFRAKTVQPAQFLRRAQGALATGEVAPDPVVLPPKRLAFDPGLRDGLLGRRQRVRGDDGLAQISFGLLMLVESRVKLLAGGAARAEQIVCFRVETRAQIRQHREPRRRGGEGFGEPSAGLQQFLAALAERLGGEAEFADENLARDRAEQARQEIVGERLVVRVQQRVFTSLAPAQEEHRAVGEPQPRADAQRRLVMQKGEIRRLAEAKQQIADGVQRRGFARFVGAEHHV